jgi:hypothetical protein
MRRIMIQLGERLLERAVRRAAQHGVSVAQIVRGCVRYRVFATRHSIF